MWPVKRVDLVFDGREGDFSPEAGVVGQLSIALADSRHLAQQLFFREEAEHEEGDASWQLVQRH